MRDRRKGGIICSLLVYFSIFLLSGCFLMPGHERLDALKSFSDNRREIEKEVETQAQLFLKLKDDIAHQRLKTGLTKDEVVAVYGEPVIARIIDNKFPIVESFLYRHPTRYFSSDKAYLYFDKYHTLISWDITQCP